MACLSIIPDKRVSSNITTLLIPLLPFLPFSDFRGRLLRCPTASIRQRHTGLHSLRLSEEILPMPCKRPCNSVGAGGGTEQGHGGDTAFGGVGLSRAGDNFSAGSP